MLKIIGILHYLLAFIVAFEKSDASLFIYLFFLVSILNLFFFLIPGVLKVHNNVPWCASCLFFFFLFFKLSYWAFSIFSATDFSVLYYWYCDSLGIESLKSLLLSIFASLFYLLGDRLNFSFSTLLFFFLAAPCGLQDCSSLTRGRTCAPCSGISESWLLDHQGSPIKYSYFIFCDW